MPFSSENVIFGASWDNSKFIAGVEEQVTALKQVEAELIDINALSKTAGELRPFSRATASALEASRSIGQLKDVLAQLKIEQAAVTNPKELLAYNNAIRNVTAEIKRMGAAGAVANTELKAVNTTALGMGKSLTSAFGSLRTLANILPGIGISGLFLLGFEAITKFISSINILPEKISVVDKVIQGTDESTKALRDSLNALGDDAESIAEGAFKKLDEATQKLQDSLGETPTAVEVAQGALVILEDKVKELTESYTDLGFAASAGFAGVDVQAAASQQQRQIQSQIDETNKLITEGNQKLNDQRIAQLRTALLGQGTANQQLLENNARLQIDANNRILADEINSFEVRRAALKNSLDKTFEINQIERNKGLQAAKDNESKIALVEEKFRFDNLKAQADFNQRLLDLNKKQAELNFGNQKALLEFEIDKQNKIRDNDKILFTFRNNAAEESFNLVNRLINLELANRKLTSTQAKIAIEKNEIDLNKNLEKIFADRFKLQAQEPIKEPEVDKSAEIQAAARKRVEEEITKLIRDAGEDRQNLISINESKEIQVLNQKRAQGLIAEKDYQIQLKQIKDSFQKESLKALIDNLEAQLARLDQFIDSNEFNALSAKIEEKKAELIGLGTTPIDDSKLIKFLTDISTIEDAIVNLYTSINETEQNSLNRTIALQQQRVENARFIAERGNAEFLALEQKRLDELQRRQAAAAERQIAIANAVAAAQALVAVISAVAKGIEEGTPILSIANVATIIGLIAAGYKFVSSLEPISPSFYEGTPFVQQGKYRSGKDTIPARVNIGEAIIPTETNRQYKDSVLAIYNKTIPANVLNEFVANYPVSRVPATDFSRLGAATDFKTLEITETNKKLDLVYGVLTSILDVNLNTEPVKTNLDIDGFTQSYLRVLKRKALRSRM